MSRLSWCRGLLGQSCRTRDACWFRYGWLTSAARSRVAAGLPEAAVCVIVGAAPAAGRTRPTKAEAVRGALLRTIVALAGGVVTVQVAAHFLGRECLRQRNCKNRQPNHGQRNDLRALARMHRVSRSCRRR